MATVRRPSSERMVETVELSNTEQQPPKRPLQPSVRGSTQQPQQQQASGWAAVEGVPVARAMAKPFAYVGIPIDGNEDDNYSSSSAVAAGGSLLPPPPGYAYGDEEAGAMRVHGNVGLGVGSDFAGAEEQARASARRDNLDFRERKRFTEAQARSRVEEDLRAIEVARINAKRRDAEGLDMRPHPGNRLEPEASIFGKEVDREGGTGATGAGPGGGAAAAAAAAAAGKGSEQEEAASTRGSGGYQCAEYEPAEYVIPEYKSIYGDPSETY